MMSIVYLAIFVVSLNLVKDDKDFDTIKEPCIVCMPKVLIIASLVCLMLGAVAFALLATRNVWVISGAMALSISGFMMANFFAWERNKRMLALLQMAYVLAITVHFYSWWYF